MNGTLAGWLQILAPVEALALSHRPLGDHIARCLTTTRHLRPERLAYRAGGVDADAEQTWAAYLRSMLAFSLVSMVFLYVFQRGSTSRSRPAQAP
ncbi:potassium-transporting ATPase subunit KdpA [Streptomyces olivoreticuli]